MTRESGGWQHLEKTVIWRRMQDSNCGLQQDDAASSLMVTWQGGSQGTKYVEHTLLLAPDLFWCLLLVEPI